MSKFSDELKTYVNDSVQEIVSKLETRGSEKKIDDPQAMHQALLNAAKKNEWETMILSSKWSISEEDTSFAVSLARLAGDEAKHLQLIEDVSGKKFDFEGQYSPFFEFLCGLEDTFSRVVAGPFTRELLAVQRNKLFLSFCEKHEFVDTIEIYKTIQNDETHHHELGLKLVEEKITNENQLTEAKKIVDRTLQVVDDIQEMVSLKKGLYYLPGC